MVDVTEQVKKLQLSSNSFTADAMTLGDPCPRKVKKLRLIFLRKLLSRRELYYDQECFGCDDIGELFEASWAVGEHFVDVKEHVKFLIPNKAFIANSETLGSDPCRGQHKQFRLNFRVEKCGDHPFILGLSLIHI